MCIGLLRPAHTPKVKYSLSKLLLWLALSARIQWPFRTSTPSQREIFFLTAQSCYCGLLSLLVYSGLSGPAHPPKEKYSLSQLLLWLALSARIQWPFRTSTPSQREIFFLTAVIVPCSLSKLLLWLSHTAVIVACSLCSYTVAFQDQHTLPKRNILSHSCYCGSLSKLLLWLALSARIQWPFRTSTPSQREIFSLTAVIVACSLCSCVLAFQDQHTLPKCTCTSSLSYRLVFQMGRKKDLDLDLLTSLVSCLTVVVIFLIILFTSPSPSMVDELVLNAFLSEVC